MEFAQGRKATPSGLDDGKATRSSDVLKEHSKDELHIKPGEDLRSFATRVNAALPIAGLTTKTKTKDGKDLLGLKVRRTRKEVKMHKLYAQWRAEERIIQERKEEERELAAERGLGHAAADTGQDAMMAEGKASARRGKKGKMRGRDQDDDPWRELTKKRGEGRIGLHDIVQAPPDLLHRKQRKQLLMGGAIVDVENVPRSAGSLRRREELQTARDDVVEAYRRIREHELAKTNA
ncbi:hypothetical protein AAL_07420 [Moelleriella libera RCEF 2490]|uniref:Urease accessory protein UreD n=1 Tax=Moelleriella libera RCEF 2490 TaxID=1081109 RepID=A0A167XCK3_9HYPO|nr:hypothetical protein AAL_07420 [Moelleriella libera RCEF 2490]